jgi:hypothetical protein
LASRKAGNATANGSHCFKCVFHGNVNSVGDWRLMGRLDG